MLILASQVANSQNQIAKANGSFSYIISSSGCYFPYLKNEGIGMRWVTSPFTCNILWF